MLSLIPRLIGIDRFATIDEPYWLTAGSDFYYALGQREFASTVYDYHPAVTTMWLVALAMLLYFPQYRGLGQGYFDVYKDSVEQFLLAHDRTPLGLLTTARVLQVVLLAALLVIVFLLLRRLLDERVAATAVLLVSFDPFYLGHSRLLTHEGMLTLFVLVSVFALMVHLFVRPSWWMLAGSGAAAGLAELTKSSAIVIFPVVGLLFLAAILQRNPSTQRRPLRLYLRDLGIWLAVLVAAYVALWPGMWVAPVRMLEEVFGNAVSYAVQGRRLSVVGAIPRAAFRLRLDGIPPFIDSIRWRATPLVWYGAVLALIALVRLKGHKRLVLLVVALTGALFIVLFGVASGRNSAHYVLAAYAALDVLAAAGLIESTRLLGSALRSRWAQWLPAVVAAGAILFQAASALAFFPYYYNYYSPVVEASYPGRQNPNFGYGEGLDLAADYLQQKPNAGDSTAMVFYGRGPFSFFYSGTTEPLKTVYAEVGNVPQLVEILRRTDYLVIYYALQRGRNAPANLMRALEGSTPEATIWHNGIEYARIYNVRSLPEAFYARLWP